LSPCGFTRRLTIIIDFSGCKLQVLSCVTLAATPTLLGLSFLALLLFLYGLIPVSINLAYYGDSTSYPFAVRMLCLVLGVRELLIIPCKL